MDSAEVLRVLRALQAREMSPAAAEKELTQKPEPAARQSPLPHPADFTRETIAITGMSGRYPGAGDLRQYWHNLVHGKNSIKEIPGSRWDVNRYYAPPPFQEGKTYCKWLGLLEDMEYFDAVFFDISHSEAELMDPQHRLFLQEGYKAFEDAGCTAEFLNNKRCGVYLGIMNNEYGMILSRAQEGMADITGSSYSIAAARLPYYLNLKGPAIPIDTACSSSLVAVHLACQALLNREIDMALAGGVSLYLAPETYIGMCRAGMLSPDGQCKPFDNRANGFVPGEGVGALVLKRLTDAESQGDHIYGVIIGSAINHDGKTNGITAPGMNSQKELEQEVYDKHNIDPGSIGYVEMHGTGTRLGDLIELEALAAVFKEKTHQKNFCAVGSVKSNIGHTSAASGLASIQKIALCMKHKLFVPTINFSTPNEHFNFPDSPFYVNTRLQPWETASDIPRRAAVSAFGYSGTNVHLVIEEYRPKNIAAARPPAINVNRPIVVVLSARSEARLKTYAKLLQEFIETQEQEHLNLAGLAYTLQVGREPMGHRLALMAASRETIINALGDFVSDKAGPGVSFLTGQVKKDREEEANHLLPHRCKTGEPEKTARAWVKGLKVDWHHLYGENPPRRISLPTYPFAGKPYWVMPATAAHDKAIKPDSTQPGRETAPCINLINEFHIIPEVYRFDEPYLRDHRVNGAHVLSGMTYASLAINAFFKIFPGENCVHLHGLNFVQPLEVKEDQQVEVLVEPIQVGAAIDFRVIYRYESSSPWDLTARGKLLKTGFESKKIDPEQEKDSLEENADIQQIYTVNPAISLGDSFRIISRLYTGPDRVLAQIALNQATGEDNHRYGLHPLVLDGVFEAAAPLLGRLNDEDGFIPFGIKDIYFRKNTIPEQFWVLAKLVKNTGEMIIFDADIINDKNITVATCTGCCLKRVHQGSNSGEPGADLPGSSEKIQKYLVNKIDKILPSNAKVSSLDTNLMEMGLTSSLLVAVTNEIEKETNIELSPALFFEYPNIKELAGFFALRHRDVFIALTGTAVGPRRVSQDITETAQTMPARSARDISSPLPGRDINRGDIAVIGIHGLFPGAEDLDRFWEHLRNKTDLIEEIPSDHWDYRPWYEKNPGSKDKTYCKWGSFIHDVDKFDAGFFNISPREAHWMDPQLRLFLQSIYAAGEDAGYIKQLRGTDTGVFVGVCCHDYRDKITEMNLPIDPHLGTGNGQSVIPNRVSFFFDFTGPSIGVDTACSSSLFALHQACRALHQKECSLAFVGGVNLLLSSRHYRYFSGIGALSPTGRCHTFDEAADGYVPGECIASILLKPLDRAQRDRDHIYAVIKGSAALHGGHTPSLTAPGVAGEENVLLKAWENAGIDPETLTYLEAHGTGTKLGDPIEINSLINAFKRFTDREHFCAVGSVKANIGHTEGAAGIAGLLKVILQMKYRQIPALPRFNTLNPYIRPDKSALYINRELEEWKVPGNGPRRAGISSFGFSGSYAHAVIEEYIPVNPEPPCSVDTLQAPVIIVLSAKNEERLQEQVRQLSTFIASREQQFSHPDLVNMAYTLQVGREAMSERLAVMANSVKELREKLAQFPGSQESIDTLYRGQVDGNNPQDNNSNKAIPAAFIGDEDLEQEINTWISGGKYARLPDLWVRGVDINWNRLYEGGEHNHYRPYQPQRISLPTYPFARERYWVDGIDIEPTDTGSPKAGAGALSDFIHPLLQQNTSDFFEQRFTSTFTGQEFFLADHVVKGRRLLVGVAYLEMVRAAVDQAAGVSSGKEKNPTGLQLKNAVWIRPLVVKDEPVQVHIRLLPGDRDCRHQQIAYEIYSRTRKNGSEAEPIIYSQGTAELHQDVENREVPTLDLAALEAENSWTRISGDQCYHAFSSIEVDYGPGLKGIRELYVDPSGHRVLAKLSLPQAVLDYKDRFVLHPGLMDSALQASIGLLLDPEDPAGTTPVKAALPFALQKLEIHGHFTADMWALVRCSNGSTPGDNVRKLDIDVCDPQGKIRVRMKGFSTRVLERELLPHQEKPVLLIPTWKPIPAAKGHIFPLPTDRLVIINGTKDNLAGLRQHYPRAQAAEISFADTVEIMTEKLEKHGTIAHILWIAPVHPLTLTSAAGEDLIENQEQGVFFCFRLIKALLGLGYGAKGLGWSVITIQTQSIREGDPVNPTHAGIHGLMGSLAREYSNWRVRVIDLEADKDWPLPELFTLPADPEGNAWGYREQQWYRQQLTPFRFPGPRVEKKLYRTGGVYVVIGGAGGIGMAWSEYMIRTYQARVIWVGRRKKDKHIRTQLDRLAAPGPAPLYITADAACREELLRAYNEIKQIYPQIHGVVHSAIVLADKSLANMEEKQFKAGLSAKVNVSIRLARVFHREPLDFVLFFSSMISFTKNPGQSNYASGCTFKDAFALQMVREWSCAVKVMNWGYWGSVGIVAAGAYRERMARAGIRSIESPEAMQALEILLASPVRQLALANARTAPVKEVPPPSPVRDENKTTLNTHSRRGSIDVTDQMVEGHIRTIIRESTALSLKMEEERIQDRRSFSEYGVDSIIAVNLVNLINKQCSIQLQTTVLFDYNNVEQLVRHIIREHKPALITNLQENTVPPQESIPMTGDKQDFPLQPIRRLRQQTSILPEREKFSQKTTPEPIAIIGMSGRFAGSETVNRLWQHLAGGTDLVQEVSRWDLSQYYPDSLGNERNYCNHGSFLEDIDRFDPLFFNISGLEATYTDPQQRFFLEESWKALEDAGYAGAALEGHRCGVYVGCSGADYARLLGENPPAQAFWGNAGSVIPARIAYFLNLQGPAAAIDTACSSSLAAIHLACQGLWTGETSLALAGGVFIQCTPSFYLSANRAGMLSLTGRCFTFDQQADGFVPGEGVGVVVLKRLQQAVADGDHIYGVIRGSAMNQDGATNGITAPSANSQERLQRRVYDTFNIDPGEISMLEAHGTGTTLGDPIEFAALTRSFARYTDKKEYCAIGSIKTNIGHAGPAAGIAGLIKVLLSLTHKKIPPSLHFRTGNANIRFNGSPFYVNTGLKDWDTDPDLRRCAAVSSFGFSGTNVHMVIEEAPQVDRQHPEKPGYIIVLSARIPEQLRWQAEQLVEVCEQEPGLDCGNISYTLLLGRKHMKHRLAAVVRSQRELAGLLKKWLEKGKASTIFVSLRQEDHHPQQASLKRFGNQCIQDCRHTGDAADYLEHLATIADLYVQGYELEFEQLFSNRHYSRISLPTYPFARERFWIPGQQSQQSGMVGKTPLTPKHAPVKGHTDELMYLPLWEEQPLVTRVCQTSPHTAHRVLLVYHPTASEFAETFLDYYRQNQSTKQKQLIRVRLGRKTGQVGKDNWECDINDAGGFAVCLAGYGAPDCLYFIPAFQGEKQAMNADDPDQCHQENEVQLLRLLKFLKQNNTIGKRNKIDNSIDCFIISQDHYRIADTHVNPYGGGITGLAYSLAQGDHRFSVRNIDISREDLATPGNREALLRLILAEGPSDRGQVIKFKNGSRYKQVFLNLDRNSLPGNGNENKKTGLKKKGVYVILGGSGTVGRIITGYLMQEYNARVVWIGRQPATSTFIQEKLETFRTRGEPPLYIRADVTDREQMQQAAAKIKSRFSIINGTIFSGLVFKLENSIEKTTEKEFLEILEVKTKGSVNFYTAFQQEPLDFMCYFSSAQAFSFSGAANLSAYAAGITFSDIFTTFMAGTSAFPVGTINWGFWKSSAAGTRLSLNSGLLEDREGFACFKDFTGLLTRGVLNQAVCLRASGPVLELMNSKEEDVISIAPPPPGGDSVMDSIRKGNPVNADKPGILVGSSDPEELEEWVSRLLFLQIRQTGLLKGLSGEKGGTGEIDALREKAGIIEKYGRWLTECLSILESRGFVQCEAGQVKVLDKADIGEDEEKNVWKVWQSVKEGYLKDPEQNARVRLTDACLQKLPGILKGNIIATDILFPGSSLEMVEGIYKNNARSDYFNTAAADFITAYIKQQIRKKPSTRLRIIEIGAGTGGTSAVVFPRIKPYAHQIEYWYTDISRSFLIYAEEKYGGDNPYLTYKLWDIEKPLAGQGIEAGSFDLAIAANVLHATGSIRQSLRNAKAALKTNGILLLNELTRKTMFATLTFGLLDGWWLYRDEGLRIPGSPLLDTGTWQRVSEEEGFRHIYFPVAAAQSLGQQIITAESDGIIRQEKKNSSALPIKPAVIPKPGKQDEPTSVEEYVKSLILDQLAESLQIPGENIETHVPFSDYGVDSIIGINFVKRVNERLGITMNSAILFDYTTIGRLSGYIVKTYSEQIIKDLEQQFFDEKISVDELLNLLPPGYEDTKDFF